MQIVPGALVTPKIQLVRELGRGGMGSVWIARHLALDMDVAVKFVAPAVIKDDPNALERFKREATVAAKIKNPHIVQVFDHGVNGDTPFIVMELLDGESLQQRIDRDRALPIFDVQEVIRQSCSALAEAHRHGVVHRDIKPDNIFLTPHDDRVFVKVLDFGIAKANDKARATRLTSTSALAGTPHYMSPEQFLSTRNVTHQADLWSLAVVAYEALTGHIPWSGGTLTALGMAVCQDQFAPVHELRPDLPRGFARFFDKALSKTPTDRHRDAREFAREFERAVQSSIGVAELAGEPETRKVTALVPTERTQTLAMSDVPDTTVDPVPQTEPAAPVAAPSAPNARSSNEQVQTQMSATIPTKRSIWLPLLGGALVASLGFAAFLWLTAELTQKETKVDAVESSAPAPRPSPAAVPSVRPTTTASAATPAPSESVAQGLPKPPVVTPGILRPKPKATPPVPPPKAKSCEGSAAYTRDAKGHLVIRPECL